MHKVHCLWVHNIQYRMAGMFARDNVWQIAKLQVVGKKSWGRFRPLGYHL